MVELMSYALTGLTVTVFIAFYCAYCHELLAARKKHSAELINNAQSTGSQMGRTRTTSLPLRERIGEQQQTATASLLQKTSPFEAEPGPSCSNTLQKDNEPLEASHG
jgi:hypothetical protein